MTTGRAALWILGLFVACICWGGMMNSAISGDHRAVAFVGGGLGFGGSVFLITAVGAVIVLAITRSIRAALRTWTALIVVGIAVLGIGAAEHAHDLATKLP